MVKNIYFPAVIVCLGVIVGAISWFVIYSIVYTPAIEFDGPAGLALGLSMIASGLLFGILGMSMYLYKNPTRKFKNSLLLCIATGLFVCVLLGYVVSKYEIQHTARCVEEGPNNTCLDEKGFFLF